MEIFVFQNITKMNKLLAAFLLFFFTAVFYGQESDAPFRKCNTIKIVPHGDTDNMMQQFADFLEKEGFNIRRMNEQKTNLRTAPFNMISNVQTNAIIHVMAPRKETKQNYLYVTAFAKQHEYGKSEYKMKETSSKYTIGGLLFEKVNELASKFAGTYNYQLVYLKNKH
jgi:hypothetical protein